MNLTEFLDKIDETARAVNPTSLSVEKRMVCLSAHEAFSLTAALRKCVEALEEIKHFNRPEINMNDRGIYTYQKKASEALSSLSESFKEMK